MPKTGFISASMAKAVMTKGRGKGDLYGATFTAMAEQVGAGLIGWDISTDISMPAMEHGNEYEWEAIQTYQERTFNEVHSSQEWQQSKCGRFGCHPDGLIGTAGMIEVKCPQPKNHLKNVLRGEQVKIYYPQVQFSLMVTGREWCNFISYDPNAPAGLDLYVQRINRDEAFIESLENRGTVMYQMAVEFGDELRRIKEGR